MTSREDKAGKPRSYFGEVIRLLLICGALMAAVLVIKTLAYSGYLGGAEFIRDLEIGGVVCVLISFLSPIAERIRVRSSIKLNDKRD